VLAGEEPPHDHAASEWQRLGKRRKNPHEYRENRQRKQEKRERR
jgi:hypothetical protein